MENFKSKYGYFDSEGTEYVIINPKTPKPWVNVISNGVYGMVISQTGGGFSWHTHSEFNRLNRWHQDLVQDNWGKYFYIKDKQTGEIFNPTFMPLAKTPVKYECRYGTGYTKFKVEYPKFEVLTEIFIPFGETFEVWRFIVNNKTKEELKLSFTSYFEFCLGSSADFHREFHKSFIETEFDEITGIFWGTKRLWEIPLGDRGHWNIEYPFNGFITCNQPIDSWEGDKEKFIGNYGSLINPESLKLMELSCSQGKWNDSIGSIQSSVTIAPGKTGEIAFFLGITEDKIEMPKRLREYFNSESLNKSLNSVKEKWGAMLSPLEIKTPDKGMDYLVNIWLRYQAISGRLWGRTAYYQQSGAFGFRDQLQDSLVYLPIDPELTAAQIKLHAKHQFQDGTVLHWWHPISETGLVTKMTDDLLWLPYMVIQYIEETGNISILNEKEPYYDNPQKQASLFEHCIAAFDIVFSRFSSRGLPLIGAGDWNDGLSAVGLEFKGESMWLAAFLYGILDDFAPLAGKLGRKEIADQYEKKALELKIKFNEFAWDGKWFSRATKDSGEKIGSRENTDGKIFLNSQTWSVITNIGYEHYQKTAMDSVKTFLLKNNGALLLSPAYSSPDKYIGYLTRYAPGRRENGGVYTHAATWAIKAFALLKDAEGAWESYKRLSPINNGMDADKYAAEPYVTPGNIDGPESPNYGMGGWTWYTGSASWFQKIIVDYILGVRASGSGLLIDPVIPADWESYSVKRKYRGCEYSVNFSNPERRSSGITQIKVDGEIIIGNIIPQQNKSNCLVEVII